jgi:hypothetical protein
MRRKALEEAGFLPPESRLLLDHELWIQLAARYPMVHVAQYWSVERSHETAKTVSLAAHYGEDAFELIEVLQEQDLLKDTIHTHRKEIIAGLHVFHGKRLIDAKKPVKALAQFGMAARIYPPAVAVVWYKVIQALGGILGLGGLFLWLRDLRRRMKNGVRVLRVDCNGARWDS